MTREDGLKRLREAREKIDAERELLRLRSQRIGGLAYDLSLGRITPQEAIALAGLCASAQKEASNG